MCDLTWQCTSYLKAKTDWKSRNRDDSGLHEPDVVLSERLKQQNALSAVHQSHVKTCDGISLHATTSPTARAAHGTADLKSINFNQFVLRDEELTVYAVEMFQNLEVLDELQIPPAEITRMVKATKARYQHQPYHNFRHAFDVLQATYCLLLETGLALSASKVELFTLMVTALLHDGECTYLVISCL